MTSRILTSSAATRRVVTVVTLAMALCGVLVATAQAEFVHNSATDKCLAIQGAQNWNGSPAFQYTCGNLDQDWTFEDKGYDGYYRVVALRNRITNRCLAVQSSQNYNGSPAFQYACGYADQRWVMVTVPAYGGFLLRNAVTHKCLAIESAKNYNGSPAFQYDCHSDWRDQVWYRRAY